jgi:hypothetical protein
VIVAVSSKDNTSPAMKPKPKSIIALSKFPPSASVTTSREETNILVSLQEREEKGGENEWLVF